MSVCSTDETTYIGSTPRKCESSRPIYFGPIAPPKPQPIFKIKNTRVKVKQKRYGMTKEQTQYLENLFQLDPNWNTADTKTISGATGLNRVKIYKWHYDRKK